MKIYYCEDIFDLYMMVLTILRPINTFIQNNLIRNIIQNAYNNFSLLIILNQFINFIVDFIFFYVLKKLVINNTLKTEKNIKNLIRCLEI